MKILVCNECASKKGFDPSTTIYKSACMCVICGKYTLYDRSREEIETLIKRFSDDRNVIMENPPLISVMIAVKDRLPQLKRALWSWSVQQ